MRVSVEHETAIIGVGDELPQLVTPTNNKELICLATKVTRGNRLKCMVLEPMDNYRIGKQCYWFPHELSLFTGAITLENTL